MDFQLFFAFPPLFNIFCTLKKRGFPPYVESVEKYD
ncbi:hypothetical protein EUBDOL_00818 [Amedibacillus dolichus DSM 3991]|uniref:Uncharacterized protein n=1 Tax=Amedibacillus dolichus DSM 3991 TaxID=428127 RepID=A8RAI2_9FIRM|nr:hypothetical protein EUBDOL_00818 [Amedibacillus dolichus DSM 3991]